MEINMNMNLILQTKQVMSQAQVQSLNILAMSMTELQDFLQREEIENPLIEYSDFRQMDVVLVKDREDGREYAESLSVNSRTASDSFSEFDSVAGERMAAGSGEESVWDMVYTQLPWNQLGEWERKIVEFCVNSLDQSGYLTILPCEIAEKLHLDERVVMQVVAKLKELEPRGIFASNLEECLCLQVRGMEQEYLLERIIREHLEHMADGKISLITRNLKISSSEARMLMQMIKGLNPRPLNGFGEEQAQYVLPDVLLEYQDGQWTIGLNDQWTGSFGISEFYMRMMDTSEDVELRTYFEDKLRRARFIMSAVEQRRQTMLAISRRILAHQESFLLGHGPVQAMTMEQIAAECEMHKSTVSRAIRDKFLLAPRGCMPMRDLFSTGISMGEDGEMSVSRNVVKEKIRELVSTEDKEKPYSDEQIAGLLKAEAISISRRTVAKYRAELGIKGVFQRREV